MIESSHENYIVYDGQCPFCSGYIKMLRIREAIGPVTLIDARNGGPVVAELRSRGYNLDKGMVLILNGAIYRGADCIHRLALISSEETWFNRLTASVFSSRILSRALYPVLRSGRLIALSLLGRKLIGGGQEFDRPTKTPFRRSRMQMLVLFMSLSVYLTVAEARHLPILNNLPITRDGEFFPFFDWSLFSHPQRYTFRYTVVPVEVVGHSTLASALNRPLETDEASFLRKVRFWKTAKNLAQAVSTGDETQIRAAKVLVDNFVKPYGVKTYQVVQQTIDPLVRDRRVIVSATVIGEFDTSE